MYKVCVFAGTTEGRELIRFLCAQGLRVTACVATEYGETLLEEAENLTVSAARLDRDDRLRGRHALHGHGDLLHDDGAVGLHDGHLSNLVGARATEGHLGGRGAAERGAGKSEKILFRVHGETPFLVG